MVEGNAYRPGLEQLSMWAIRMDEKERQTEDRGKIGNGMDKTSQEQNLPKNYQC